LFLLALLSFSSQFTGQIPQLAEGLTVNQVAVGSIPTLSSISNTKNMKIKTIINAISSIAEQAEENDYLIDFSVYQKQGKPFLEKLYMEEVEINIKVKKKSK
jgi:hypothetical protein